MATADVPEGRPDPFEPPHTAPASSVPEVLAPTPSRTDRESEDTATWSDLCGATPRKDARDAGKGGLETLSVGIDQFARDLVDSGLIDEAELGEVAGRLEPGGPATDADGLARELVRLGRITAYQAAAVLQGKVRGLVIGNYRVLEKLGSGGMGLVFKARHWQMKRVVALKVLPPSFSSDRSAVQRFLREVRAAAHVSHRHVVAALDAGEFHGLHYLVMEYVEGCDLAGLIRKRGKLTVARAIDFTLQAGRGLREAHARGIFHRDIKPSNLLLDTSDTVKVCDLGLARFHLLGEADPAAAELTHDGTLMGTVDFMPPEQAFNSKLADDRSDIYSLGCTLYFLLTGSVPFPAETLMARLLAHREAPIPSLLAARPDVPPSLDAIYRTMLAKSPEDRQPSMETLIDELESCLSDLTGSNSGKGGTSAGRQTGSRPPGPRSVTFPPSSRSLLRSVSQRWVLAAPVLLAIGLAMSLLRGWRGSHDGGSPPGGRIVSSEGGKASEIRAEGGNDRATVPVESVHGPEPKLAASETVGRTPTPEPLPRPGIMEAFVHGEGKVEAVAASADGRRAVSGGDNRVLRIWGLPEGRDLGSLAHGGPVFAVALLPDGLHAATASGDRTVRLWDLDARRETGRFSGHTRKVNSLAVSPDGRRLLAGGDDETGRLWDVASRRPLRTFPHGARIHAVAFSPDGQTVLTAGADASVRLWDAEGGMETGSLSVGAPVLCLAVAHDGRLVLTGCETGRLTVWDLGGRTALHDLEGGPHDWVRTASFLPGAPLALTCYRGGEVRLWDADSGRTIHRFLEGPVDRLGLAVLPDGVRALTADGDGRVRLWNLPPR